MLWARDTQRSVGAAGLGSWGLPLSGPPVVVGQVWGGMSARALAHGRLLPAAEEESGSFYVLLTVTPVVLMVLISCLAVFVFFYNKKR